MPALPTSRFSPGVGSYTKSTSSGGSLGNLLPLLRQLFTLLNSFLGLLKNSGQLGMVRNPGQQMPSSPGAGYGQQSPTGPLFGAGAGNAPVQNNSTPVGYSGAMQGGIGSNMVAEGVPQCHQSRYPRQTGYPQAGYPVNPNGMGMNGMGMNGQQNPVGLTRDPSTSMNGMGGMNGMGMGMGMNGQQNPVGSTRDPSTSMNGMDGMNGMGMSGQQNPVGSTRDPSTSMNGMPMPTGGNNPNGVVMDNQQSPVGSARDSGTSMDGMPMQIGGTPRTDAGAAPNTILNFVQQFGPMHTQWHMNRNQGIPNAEGFLLFHHDLIGSFQRAGGPQAFGGITPYTENELARMGAQYNVNDNEVRAGDLNSLVRYSNDLENWHNGAHMAIGPATGISTDVMMNPSINIGLSQFWKLHYFVEDKLNSALQKFRPDQSPDQTIAQLEQSSNSQFV